MNEGEFDSSQHQDQDSYRDQEIKQRVDSGLPGAIRASMDFENMIANREVWSSDEYQQHISTVDVMLAQAKDIRESLRTGYVPAGPESNSASAGHLIGNLERLKATLENEHEIKFPS